MVHAGVRVTVAPELSCVKRTPKGDEVRRLLNSVDEPGFSGRDRLQRSPESVSLSSNGAALHPPRGCSSRLCIGACITSCNL